MIDTKELRRLAQDATPWRWYVGTGTYEGRNIYSANAITDSEGFTYQPVIATAEDNDIPHWDANAAFIAAANPAAISELLDRLEAAEKKCDDVAQQLVQSEQGKRKISEECDALRTALRHEADCVEAAKAKIEAMERQKPVGKFTQHPSNGLWEQDGYGDNPDARPLYALYGAKREEK